MKMCSDIEQAGHSVSADFAKIVGFAICLGLFLLVGCQAKKPAPPPPPKVTVKQPEQRTVTDSLELTGNTQAINTVQLVARVPGYLEKVFFQDGQTVKKGQTLFLIQQNTYEARLQQAEGQILTQEAQLEYAGNQFVRYSALLPEKAAAQSDVDNWKYQRDAAQANLKTAVAQRDLARLDLGYTKVAAPFDGRIDRRLQDPGNFVGTDNNNSVLAQFNQIDPIYVYFTISDTDLARLVKSAHGIPGRDSSRKWPVFIGLNDEKDYPHQGTLDFASISLAPTSGTLLMRGVFSNPSGRILPGLFARVQVPLEKKAAFLLPEAALGNDQQGDYVLVVNEKHTVERHPVKTGPPIGSLRVIEQGLNGREWVITSGVLKAGPGRQVTPVVEDGSEKK